MRKPERYRAARMPRSSRTTSCRCRMRRWLCWVERGNCRSRMAWSFPTHARRTGVIPDVTVRRMMWRAGIPASPHGFRWTFRTWAQERGENCEAAEINLSYRVRSSVVASCARSDMAALRRGLMERYAEALVCARLSREA